MHSSCPVFREAMGWSCQGMRSMSQSCLLSSAPLPLGRPAACSVRARRVGRDSKMSHPCARFSRCHHRALALRLHETEVSSAGRPSMNSGWSSGLGGCVRTPSSRPLDRLLCEAATAISPCSSPSPFVHDPRKAVGSPWVMHALSTRRNYCGARGDRRTAIRR